MANEWKKPMEWNNEGVEPSDNLKSTGFQAGYKPPAAIFNFFIHLMQKCIEQLQQAVDNTDAEVAKKADKGHTHNYAGSASAGGAATTALTCTGNSATATKATQDENGNNIAETYATKGELPTKTSQLTNDSGFKTTDNNTTYALSKSGVAVTLTGSDGSTTSVVAADVCLPAAVATSSDGVAYTSTIDGITALTAGLAVVMVPNRVSASTSPTLNLNGLGAKGIRRRLSNLATSIQTGYANSWLAANKAFLLIYDGTYWIVDGLTKPAVADLYGTLSIDKGGTGATTATEALTALGAANQSDLEALEADLEALETTVSQKANQSDLEALSSVQKASGSWENAGTITCGFRPDVVFITDLSTNAEDYTGEFSKVWYTAMPYKGNYDGEYYNMLEVTDTGFIVRDYDGTTFNDVDHIYYYLAVKFG